MDGDKILHIYDYGFSSDNTHAIYTYIDKNDGEMKCSLSSRTGLYYSPVVNERGDFAYALYINNNSSGSVYLNEDEIYSNGLYNDLVLTDACLLINYERLYDNKSFLIIYDISSAKEKKRLAVDWYLRYALLSIDQNVVFFEGFNKKTYEKELVRFDLRTQKLRAVPVKGIPYIIRNCIVSIPEDSSLDSIIMMNALSEYINTDRYIPFSVANNYLGRISWNESYRMLSLARLYELTGSELVEEQIAYSVAFLLDRWEKDAWETRKYSVSKNTPLHLMVDQSMILYALLRNISYVSEQNKKRILDIGNRLFDKYEYFWNVRGNGSGYYFEKGIDFQYDGCIQPWNQQNAWGLCMIELYKQTYEQKYADKLHRMMSDFKTEWEIYLSCLIWHYWPQEFYDGWDIEDGVSVNTPAREYSSDSLYEDVSHSGINVAFILAYYDCFGDSGAVTEDDIHLLNNTLSSILTTRFSRFIKINSDYPNSESLQYFPSAFWVLLNNSEMREILSRCIPSSFIHNDFDMTASLTYLLAIDIAVGASDILLTTYNNNVQSSSTLILSSSEFIDWDWF